MSKQRRPLRILACAIVGLAVVTTACGGGDDEGTVSPAAADSGQTVSLRLIAFKPENLTVPVGTAVTWRNEDASEHTVTSGTVSQSGGGVTSAADSKFESGSLKQNAAFAFTFTAPGTYAYFCKIHPATMRGEITVR